METHKCLQCRKECKKIRRCKECKSGLYCSSKCRKEHKEQHKELCTHITELEKLEQEKKVMSAFSVREKNQVKLKVKNNLVKLIGEKPTILDLIFVNFYVLCEKIGHHK